MNREIPNSCQRCGKPLKQNREVWMELDNTSGLYLDSENGETLPKEHISQGGFPFGRDCRRAILREQA